MGTTAVSALPSSGVRSNLKSGIVRGGRSHGVLATAHFQLAEYDESARWARLSVEKHRYNLPAYQILAAALAHLGRTDEANTWLERLTELDPEITISRIQAIYPISRYRNLDAFLEGLRKAGFPESQFGIFAIIWSCSSGCQGPGAPHAVQEAG